MTDRPTPDAQSAFEARLTSVFAAYTDRAPVDVDAVRLAAVVAQGGASRHRSRLTGARGYLMPVLLGLLLIALAAGVAVVGSRLLDRRPDAEIPQQPAIVGPSASPSADVTAAPVSEPYVEPTRQPDPSVRPLDQPCPAMVELLAQYSTLSSNPSDPIAAAGRVTGNGDVLLRVNGEAIRDPAIRRLDPSQSPPAPVDVDGIELPFQAAEISRFIDPRSRLVVSPDGRALAIEAGDFGYSGCGDPIVVPAGNGFRRPFPGRAFELISDLAWAPDGSALYGIRRPTRDALGMPYMAELARGTQEGPGTVLRWDTATGEVTELPSGCERCTRLFVSPDGTRIAADSAGVIKVSEADGGWRDLIAGDRLAGWVDDQSVLVFGDDQGRRVSLDGSVAARWGPPSNDNDGQLSPDGTTFAVILDSAQAFRNVTLLDTRDGSTRTIWSAPMLIDCSGMRSRSADCERRPSPAPDSTGGLSAYARIAAWAPDGTAVLVLDQGPDSTAATLRVVPVNGYGAGAPVTVQVPNLTDTLGFPNIGPSVVWLPATEP